MSRRWQVPELKQLTIETLRRLAPIDALVYGFTFDSGLDRVTLNLEIDPRCDVDVAAELALAIEDEVIVDFLFGGVRSASVRDAVPRSAAVEPDEPPQEYEIASWSIREHLLRKSHTLEIKCYLGTVFTVEFQIVGIKLSERKPGQRHDYSPKIGPRP
jgi:hypothetical protein